MVRNELRSENSIYTYYLNGYWRSKGRGEDELLYNSAYVTADNSLALKLSVEERLSQGDAMKEEELIDRIRGFEIHNPSKTGGRLVHTNVEDGKLYFNRSGLIISINPPLASGSSASNRDIGADRE